MRQTAKRCGRWLAVLLVLGILIGCRWVFPRRDRIAGEAGTVTTAQSVTEAQGRNQCGGCSAAYLLRADGKDITGAEAYAEIPLKLPNGYLLPQGIRSYLRQEGYPAVMRRGTPDQLCARLREGLPVIALIQEGEALHYVAVVGCDSESLYLADSLCPPAEGYNRVVSREEFARLQQIGLPGFEEVYITAAPDR